jgi:hypothetical protein
MIRQMKYTDRFTAFTNIGSRAFCLLHYVFDNLYIITKTMNFAQSGGNKYLASSKVLEWTKNFYRISRLSWLCGIVLYVIYCIKVLRKTYTDESDLKVAALHKMTVSKLQQNLRIIGKLRADYWLNFVMATGDLLICLNENDLMFKVVGKRLNTGFEGAFGMASSLIYLYSLL